MATALRNARLQEIADAIDGGAGAGTLKIYDGTRPATGAAITTETLGATLTFSDPSAATIAAGLLTFAAITEDASADANITASWARVADSTGAFVCDLDVGATGSGADIEITNVNIIAGEPVSTTGTQTITEGGA